MWGGRGTIPTLSDSLLAKAFSLVWLVAFSLSGTFQRGGFAWINASLFVRAVTGMNEQILLKVKTDLIEAV
jgi:hypothetical protein